MMYSIVKNGCMLLCEEPEPTLLVLNGSQSSIAPVIVQAVAGWSATEQFVEMAALVDVVPLLELLPSLASWIDWVPLGLL